MNKDGPPAQTDRHKHGMLIKDQLYNNVHLSGEIKGNLTKLVSYIYLYIRIYPCKGVCICLFVCLSFSKQDYTPTKQIFMKKKKKRVLNL